MSNPPAPSKPQEVNFWELILAPLSGVFLVVMSMFFYFDITRFEAEGGTRRLWWPVWILYNLGGKWPVVVIGVILGMVITVVAVRRLLAVAEAHDPTKK